MNTIVFRGKEHTAKPCPFCGSSNLDMTSLNDAIHSIAQEISCANKRCMAKGPTRAKPDTAIKAWNKAVRMTQ